MYPDNRPIPGPAKPLEAYYTTFQVKERGWNPTMIQELMPRADAARASWGNQGGSGATVKLYLKERVEELETTEDYLIVEEKTRKRTEKRLHQQQAVIDIYVAQFKPRFRYGKSHSGKLSKAFCCEQAVLDWQRTHEAAAKKLSARRRNLAAQALLDKCLEIFARRFPTWQEPEPVAVQDALEKEAAQ